MRILKTNVITSKDGGTIYIDGTVSSSNNSASETSDYSKYSEVAGKLEHEHLLWGQPFNGTQDVSGDMTGVGNITASGTINAESINAQDATITQIDAYDVNSTNVNAANATLTHIEAQDATITQINSQEATITQIDADDVNSTNVNTYYIGATNGSITSISGTNSNYTNYTGQNATFDYAYIEELLSKEITTENLTVTKTAHFFELIIDKIKAAGGAVLLTPADGFKIDKVVTVGSNYKLMFKTNDGERAISNMWRINDQAICQSFNQAQVGTNYNVSNKYYWCLVIDVGTETVEEEDYHYITISTTICDGTVNPEEGDEIAMLGYRGNDDSERQSAIYMSAYTSLDTDLHAPLWAHYQGINDFNLRRHKKTWFAANNSNIAGNVNIGGGGTIDDVLDGIDAISVLNTTHYYLKSSLKTGITISSSGWSTTVPELDPINKYLWTYIVTTYSDNHTETVDPYICGNYASDGENAIAVYVYSVNGYLTLYGDREVDLYAEVWNGSENITSLLPPNLFSWERVSDDTQSDENWNLVHQGYGKTLHLTDSDIYKKAVFNCVLNVESIKQYIN